MKAIVEYSQEEIRAMDDVFDELKEKTKCVPRAEMFDNFKKHRKYAHYDFSGRVSDKLIEALGRIPTQHEVIMLVDNGYCHFGACCRFSTDRDFTGYVNID